MTERREQRLRVDGVLFDIDDTLVDTFGAFVAALTKVADAFAPNAEPEDLLTVWRADANGHYARYTRGEVDYRTQRMARANELHLHVGGQELDDAAYDAWEQVFEEGFSQAWAADPEAHEVVDRLVHAGLAVGALSNAAVAYQTSKLERVGLDERVPMLVGVDTLGVGKPDVRVFEEACRRLGTVPERTVYVGDELDTDARGAVAAGLQGVWVDRPGRRPREIPEADVTAARDAGVVVIASLAELPAVLGL